MPAYDDQAMMAVRGKPWLPAVVAATMVFASACLASGGRPPSSTRPSSTTQSSTQPSSTQPSSTPVLTTSATVPEVTSIAAGSSSSTTATAATVDPPVATSACTAFAGPVLQAAQRELRRLDPLEFDSLVTDDTATDLSDGYKLLVRKVRADAVAGGCDRDALNRLLINRAELLIAHGPVAVAAKASASL